MFSVEIVGLKLTYTSGFSFRKLFLYLTEKYDAICLCKHQASAELVSYDPTPLKIELDVEFTGIRLSSF